jgi:hypothetical protein
MSKRQIEKSVKEQFNKLKEMMNPIDEERLQLDAVNNCKKVVKTFYQKKIVKSNQLMHDLDRMTVERPYIMELKKHFI